MGYLKFRADSAPPYVLQRVDEVMRQALISGRRKPVLSFGLLRDDGSPGRSDVAIVVRGRDMEFGRWPYDVSASSPTDALLAVQAVSVFVQAILLGSGTLWQAKSGWSNFDTVRRIQTSYDRPQVTSAPGEIDTVLRAIQDAAHAAGKGRLVAQYKSRPDDYGPWVQTRLPADVEHLESLIYERGATHVAVDHIELWSVFRGWNNLDRVLHHLRLIYGNAPGCLDHLQARPPLRPLRP